MPKTLYNKIFTFVCFQGKCIIFQILMPNVNGTWWETVNEYVQICPILIENRLISKFYHPVLNK